MLLKHEILEMIYTFLFISRFKATTKRTSLNTFFNYLNTLSLNGILKNVGPLAG